MDNFAARVPPGHKNKTGQVINHSTGTAIAGDAKKPVWRCRNIGGTVTPTAFVPSTDQGFLFVGEGFFPGLSRDFHNAKILPRVGLIVPAITGRPNADTVLHAAAIVGLAIAPIPIIYGLGRDPDKGSAGILAMQANP